MGYLNANNFFTAAYVGDMPTFLCHLLCTGLYDIDFTCSALKILTLPIRYDLFRLKAFIGDAMPAIHQPVHLLDSTTERVIKTDLTI